MFSGVKVHWDSSGSPEQDRVTNRGVVSAAAFSGVTVAIMVPDLPMASDSAPGATEI
jgi:hypothetical protein